MSTSTLQMDSVASPAAREFALLEALNGLLNLTIDSLSQGAAGDLLQVSRRIEGNAAELSAALMQLSGAKLTLQAQQERRRLVAGLREQRCLCRALLRRWRRSITLRQQLLGVAGDSPYTESRWC